MQGPPGPGSCVEAASLGEGGGIPRAMQDADHGQLGGAGDVIDGVGTLESHAQPLGELLTGRADSRMAAELLHLVVNPGHLPSGRGLGDFDGQIRPDFGEIGFGGVGQAEGERPANSFRPRSMILSMSKLVTRPAERSAMPLSISARRASSSPSLRLRFTFQSRSASRMTSLVEA